MLLRRLALGIVAILTLSVMGGSVAFAQVNIVEDICDGEAAGSALCEADQDNSGAIVGPNGIMTRVIQTFVYIAGALSVIMLVIGGLRYVVSNGDPSQTKAAKDTILYAVVGLVIAIFAQAIVIFVLNRI